MLERLAEKESKDRTHGEESADNPHHLVDSHIVHLDVTFIIVFHQTADHTALILHLLASLLHVRALKRALGPLLGLFHEDTTSSAKPARELILA